MAHYAFLDENNIVTEVITGVDETITKIDFDGNEVGGSSEAWESYYGNKKGQVCKRTSYNGNYRKNYAGVGYIYSYEYDAFYEQKPFESWVFNEVTCKWQPPIPYSNNEKYCFWDEESQSWTLYNTEE
jgi:hypothetical protein